MKATQWIGMAVLGAWCLAGASAMAEDKPARAGSKAEAKAEAGGEGKVNINAATKTQLMKLEGVGAGTAQRIIAYREANGPFKRPQDLAKVEGVGKGVLEKNGSRITVR